MNYKMDFSKIILSRAREIDMSLSDLARHIGISPQHMSNLVKGRKRWNETTMTRACEALDLKMDFIVEKTKKTKSKAANQ